jgi:multiple sugar transport system substrate-binding protein
VKKSMLRYLPFIVGGIAVLGVIIFILSRVFGGGGTTPVATTPTPGGPDGTTDGARQTVPSQQTTLTYWGLWESNDVLEQVFRQFEQENPGVTIQYTQHSPKDYRERLQTAIASGTGPDLFRFHASWTPMLRNELSPIPANIYSTAEFNNTFYPAAAQQLQLNGQLVGVPLMYEGLALYYNKDMLQSADAQPPTTWAELRTLATKLAVRNGDTLQRGGVAVGNASNVEHFSDIIGLLMLQNGADPSKPTSPEARDALLFYTNFAKSDKVWDDSLPSSTIAFARGDVAMMFAPSWRVHEIKTQNPSLNFGIAPVPKLGDDKVAWATFWAEGVNTQSKSKDMSWKLLKYLSSADVQQKLYSDQSSVRSFGEIYSRKDLANQLAGQELVAPYLSDAPEAQGWYLSSFTHDNGINDQLIKYYQDAVNAILGGKSVEDVLLTVDQGTKQVLRQYGVSVPAAATNPAAGG